MEYENLANAIILQAVEDYRWARVKYRKDKNEIYKEIIKECEKFFISKWFETLTTIDGKELLKKLKEE